MGISQNDISLDIEAISRLDAVPTLLRVVCETTGMGFAAVARVTDTRWTACAVRDDISFGLGPGGELDVHTTLCKESRVARAPVVIDHASTDPTYRDHHTPKIYGIESYISVPIVLPDGEYFGNLCAIDPNPAKVSEPRIVSLFTLFAQLIALQLDNDRKQRATQAEMLDSRATGELREQFIAILGHDLRNPLAAVAACGQVLERKPDPDVAAMAKRIGRNVKRMSALIDDVLDFARGRLGGGLAAQMAEVDDIDDALSAVALELRDANPLRDIAFDIDVKRTVVCDRQRIQQLASNLLANALTHGSATGRVSLTASLDGDVLVISVANDGDPIPADSIPKVFGPFWRRTTSAQREGLGLGLYICAQIVKAHRGDLEVTSSLEHGTRFVARIPVGR